MRRTMTHIAPSLLLAIALASGGVAQEVRVNEADLFASDEYAYGIARIPGGFAHLFESSGKYCGGTVLPVLVFTDDRGRFTSGDVVNCAVGAIPDLASLPSGELLVVWIGDDVPGSSAGVLGRVFDSTGSPLTPQFIVNEVTAGWQERATVTAVVDRFAAAWEDETRGSVYGRVVMPDGTMAGPEVLLPSNTSPRTGTPRCAPSPSGGVLATWWRAGAPWSDIMVRTFDANLLPLSTEVLVNQSSIGGSGGAAPIASGPTSCIVIWSKYINSTLDVMARYLDAGGAPSGSEFVVNTYTTDHQWAEAAGIDGSGRAVVAWTSQVQATAGHDLFAQRFDASGQRLGPEFRVNGTTFNDQGGAELTILPAGDFVIDWSSFQDTNTTSSAFTRRYFFPMSLAIAPGRGSTNPPTVLVSKPDGTAVGATIPAYGTLGFGANVGAGDIDGGATGEVLTGPGPSPVFGPRARAFRSAGTSIAKVDFFAYGTLRYGVRAAGGKIDADGYAEILTAPGEGPVFGPHIRGWDFDNASLQPISKVSFFAYGTLKYGARVAGGDVDGDGMSEMLTAPGPGVPFGPQIRAFNYDGIGVGSINKVNFNPFATTGYGSTVGSADVESDGTGRYGDGYEEILAGKGPGSSFDAEVRLFDYDNAAVAQKFVLAPPYASFYGATVAGGDVDAGDTEEVVTAPGPDPTADAHIICWEWEPGVGRGFTGLDQLGPDDFVAFQGPPQMFYGANVAVGTFQ